MLALTRKTGDAIMINNNIEITVLEVRGDQVKIGISAPKDISIYRKEVYLEIQKENEAAQQINMDDVEALKNLL
ncbi:carbon storage regulator CsrA [Pseudobutyrivibrio xylanivorans]|uniref:Translational regulator CsrA n=1 Tax=Pseudobutyrivibrio xylanivorans TaxID=185007 RepID=A0A5P6VMY0_PSEXY|nr:carbon storage regulator CsrA [Pseudobutyrivibrio xylanivorans]QFJ54013.1 carbon storage regulator CsrA [Pseudobutyrivibrio xylanivorans]